MPALPRRSVTLSAWALGLLLGLVPAVTGAAPPGPSAPRDELLRFVSDDVGFCLVVQDVRAHSAMLAASPFAGHFRTSRLGKSVANSPELRKLKAVDKVLAEQVGMDWARLRDDVLGEAVVFAFRPGPPGKPEQDQALVLVRARTAKALASVVERLNAGLRELNERDHNGVKYYRRVERGQMNYYYLRGPVLAFSSNEDVLRRAIDQERAATGVAPPVTARLRKLGLERAPLALWINPRAWDAEVDGRVLKVNEGGARTFQTYWKAIQDVGLAIHLDRDLALSLAVRARTEGLPPAARRFLAEASKPAEVWRYYPDNALLAVGGRIDAAALFELLSEFMSKKARQSLQADLGPLSALLDRNVVEEVLPNLGPDWGLCITAPPAEDKGWAPRVALALRIAPGDAAAPVDQALLAGLRTWAALAVAGHNKLRPDQPIHFKATTINKIRVQYLEGERAFPPGAQPAFALKGGYLVLASSVEQVRRFGTVLAPATTGPAPLLRISFKDWRAYLKDRREPLAGALAQRDKITPEAARARLDALRNNLELIDRLELRQRTSAGQVTFTLSLTPGQALRK